jgi:hypothetical protein
VIVQEFLTFLHGLAVSLFGWLHSALPTPPSFISDLSTAIDTVLGQVPHAVRYFVPLGPTVAAGGAFVGLLVAVGALRVGRRVLSLFTGGGGNA